MASHSTPRLTGGLTPPSPASHRSTSLGSQGSAASSSQATETPTHVPPSRPRRASLLAVQPNGSKSRARDLLRKHYGLGVGPPPPSNPSKGSTSTDPMDLNSTAFDAKSYYEQLITTSSLPTLLKQENELLTEIRQLDSERQSLVYNHHHELIAASDTIGAMKTHAESLEADLDRLREAFSEISRLSADVSIETDRQSRGQNHDRRQDRS